MSSYSSSIDDDEELDLEIFLLFLGDSAGSMGGLFSHFVLAIVTALYDDYFFEENVECFVINP